MSTCAVRVRVHSSLVEADILAHTIEWHACKRKHALEFAHTKHHPYSPRTTSKARAIQTGYEEVALTSGMKLMSIRWQRGHCTSSKASPRAARTSLCVRVSSISCRIGKDGDGDVNDEVTQAWSCHPSE